MINEKRMSLNLCNVNNFFTYLKNPWTAVLTQITTSDQKLSASLRRDNVKKGYVYENIFQAYISR